MTSCGFEIAEPANVVAAVVKVEQAMTPGTTEQCEGWLVLLQAATAHRSDTEVGAAVAYSLYAAELKRWPADVAKAACERLARGKPGQTGTNWFPTLAELVAECERLAAPRKAMLAGLQNWGPPEIPHVNDRRHGEPSEAEKAAVHKSAQQVAEELRETAKRMTPGRRVGAEIPNTAGKPDEGGLTPEMRASIARRAERPNL